MSKAHCFSGPKNLKARSDMLVWMSLATMKSICSQSEKPQGTTMSSKTQIWW